ncbi:methyltransferase domain-containing protein [Candidatus Nitrosopumilus koreensis]|nr:methyltransferase domain-containing protein [Candidatus Nitrosopumilus koreensis]
MGFTKISGVEINSKAIDIARKTYPNVQFYNSSIEDLELPEKSFDLVFTSGVLMHINPEAVEEIIKKMLKLSKKYIFGFESYSETLTSISYRGNNNKYWKQNFPKLFQKIEPKLNLLKERKVKYINQKLYDVFYLFEI